VAHSEDNSPARFQRAVDEQRAKLIELGVHSDLGLFGVRLLFRDEPVASGVVFREESVGAGVVFGEESVGAGVVFGEESVGADFLLCKTRIT
jgi:hypothetical protein